MNSFPASPPTYHLPAVQVCCDKEGECSVAAQLNATPLPLAGPVTALNLRTETAVNSDSPLASAQATTSWFDNTVEDFAHHAEQTSVHVQDHIQRFRGVTCNRHFIAEVKESALKQVTSLHKRVSRYFTDHGSANWQRCMAWLIRLCPEQIGCREQLNLLPVELIAARPDLPQQLADRAQTIDQLAAQSRLSLFNRTDIGSQQYRNCTVNSNKLLEIYLLTTSTLRYRFLQAALERAPLQRVQALLRHWLHDEACEDIAARLTAAPLHPIMLTRTEPLLQDLLTLCATRLLQPTRRSPVGLHLPAIDDSLVQKMADCDHKVSFGRTVGAMGAGSGGRNLYLKCRRLDETESDFMAEPVMLCWLCSTELALESATLKPHGITTFKTLVSLFEELHLSAKQKNDLTRTIAYNKQELLGRHVIERLFVRHAPCAVSASDELYERPQNSDWPYCNPPPIKTEQQLADFLLNLPFPEKNRAAFIDDQLPALDRNLRAHIVQKISATLSDEQHWQLLRATLSAQELQLPAMVYLFSTPAEAHYHRYVTDSDLQSEASQPLAERPQTEAFRAYLRDYGRLFHQGMLEPL